MLSGRAGLGTPSRPGLAPKAWHPRVSSCQNGRTRYPGRMDTVLQLVDIVLHLDRFLSQQAAALGWWLYPILFLVIFAETGLVVTPILPGDSLLFGMGAIAALADSGI